MRRKPRQGHQRSKHFFTIWPICGGLIREVFLIKKQLGFAAFSDEPAALPSKTQVLGKHGPWHYHGEQWGWLKDGLSLELHKEVVSAQP